MSTLFEFERNLDEFSRQVGLAHAIVVKKVALDLFGLIVKGTPVDKGRARASWTIAVGAPDRTTQPEGDYPLFQHDPAAVAVVARQKGEAVLSGLEARADADGVIREPIYISNNLPYIEELEQGHSKQAPSGMAELAIIQVDLEMNLAMRAAGVL